MSDTEKQVKPKRVMSEEQKAKLAEARKKANEIRAQKKAERLLEKEVNQLEKAEKIETLKQKKEKLTKKPVVQEPEPEPEEQEEEEEVVYMKKPKQKLPSAKPKPKKKKKIVYYEESSSDEEPEIVYKKRPKGTKTKEEVEEIKNKVESNLDEPQKPQFYQGNFLSDEMIKRQYNAELENARIQEMLKYMKPQNNWQR